MRTSSSRTPAPACPQSERDPHLRALRPRHRGPPSRRHRPRPGPRRRARRRPRRRGVGRGPSRAAAPASSSSFPAGRGDERLTPRRPLRRRMLAVGLLTAPPCWPACGVPNDDALPRRSGRRPPVRHRPTPRRRARPPRRSRRPPPRPRPADDHHDPDTRRCSLYFVAGTGCCSRSSASAPLPVTPSRGAGGAAGRPVEPTARGAAVGRSRPARSPTVAVTGGVATVDLAPAFVSRPRRRASRPCPSTSRSPSVRSCSRSPAGPASARCEFTVGGQPVAPAGDGSQPLAAAGVGRQLRRLASA